MIDQFCMPGIRLLQSMGVTVEAACNFNEGNTSSHDRVEAFKSELNEQNVKYHQVDFARNALNLGRAMLAYKQLDAVLEHGKYSLIHCHSPIGGVIGRLLANKHKIKKIYTAHGFHFYKGAPLVNWLIYYPVERLMARYTDILITLNKEDYNRARKFKAGRVEYVPGVGVDTEGYASKTVDKKAKRIELGIPSDAFLVLSVGEINKNKNHEVVVKAIARLCNPDVYYIICGQGKYDNYIKNIAHSHDLENRIKVLGFRTDIIEIYKTSDIFILPSLREGLPVALMEAMACGLPVVCSKIRGNRDLIENGKGGYLCEPRNADEYRQAIEMLRGSDILRKNMGEYNKKAIQNHDISIIEKQMKKIYMELDVQ